MEAARLEAGVTASPCKDAARPLLVTGGERLGGGHILSVQCGDSHRTPGGRHAGHIVPLPRLRVPPLHRV